MLPQFFYLYNMTKRTGPLLGILLMLCYLPARSQDAKQLYETAQAFIKQSDYANAILVLNRALVQDPKNTAMSLDLAQCYYYQNDAAKALETIKPLLDRDDADDQCFQVAGMIYKYQDDNKECEKVYRKGIRKFPESGPLYNELGELLWAQQDYSAIKQWEKGIEMDPSYSKNYYNACRFYYFSTDRIWSILYGEIFVNMEPLSNRTPEIKNILLESYKKLFADADLMKNSKGKGGFTDAFLKTMNKQSATAGAGINPETLTMIRARFILDWYNDYGAKYPFRLFEQQRQLLQEGIFDAYNQWIFGAAQNLAAYQNWTNAHPAEYSEFNRFQKGRIFKIPKGQYYQ